MFLSDAQIKAQIAAHLSQAEADLDDVKWGPIIQQAHQAAYRAIRGALLLRGFTQAQVDAFDDGAFYERTLSLFFAGISGSFGEAYDLTAIKAMDLRRDLEGCQVFISGEWVRPGTGAAGPGTVNTGQQRTSGCSTFGDSAEDIKW